MDRFNTSLFREKFLIKNKGDVSDSSGKVIDVKTNRISFTLGSDDVKEEVVVRTKRAYISMILASRILRDYFYEDEEALLKRIIPVEWDALWASTLSDYEKKYNPDMWAGVYINGNPIFKFQEPELLDVVEKCAFLVADNYDEIPETLENLIEKAGESKTVEYDSELASKVEFSDDVAVCNVVNQHDGEEETLEIKVAYKDGQDEDRAKLIEESLLLCAAYLEMFDLASYISETQSRLDAEEIDQNHEDVKKMRNAIARSNKVSDFIKEMEKEHEVEYAPERPKFA